MVPQPLTSSTADALAPLHEAEQKILCALTAASLSIRSLSTPTARATFPTHSATFLKDLNHAQYILRQRIETISADIPFENITLRRLVEADLSLQRTSHVHRSLVRILAAFDETPNHGAASAAPSPGWMPSPLASTPLGALGVAPSPAGGAITIPVPTPEAAAAGGAGAISAAVALNGAVQEDEAEGDRMEL